jgi:hypothetical protein
VPTKLTGEKKTVRIEVWVTAKQAAYVDDLIKLEGFGDERPEVFRRFAWAAINELIATKRLDQR